MLRVPIKKNSLRGYLRRQAVAARQLKFLNVATAKISSHQLVWCRRYTKTGLLRRAAWVNTDTYYAKDPCVGNNN